MEKDAYAGQNLVRADIQRAIAAGRNQDAAELQELDDALEIQSMFGRSWHEAPDAVRALGPRYWPSIVELYDDIPEFIARPAAHRYQSRSRAGRFRQLAAVVVTVAALVAVGMAISEGDVQAREDGLSEAEAGLERRWAQQEEIWEQLIGEIKAQAPPEEHVPIYIDDEE